MSPIKMLLIDAIKGRGVPMRDADQLIENGLAVFTGNQHNERWEWVDAKLHGADLTSLDELYGYLVNHAGKSMILTRV